MDVYAGPVLTMKGADRGWSGHMLMLFSLNDGDNDDKLEQERTY